MASSATRLQIVMRAVKQAGRGPELYSYAKELLNDLLRSWALQKKYPSLKKIGATVTLNPGQTTADLPVDFGAGMDNLLFGVEMLPLEECEADEFVHRRGFQGVTNSTGRPRFYMVDKTERKFRFNCPADTSYGFTPIYYRLPEDLPLSQDGDNVTVWFDDNKTVIQGLVAELYQFLQDPREFTQEQKVDALKGRYERGSEPIGGGSTRLQLSRKVFKSSR